MNFMFAMHFIYVINFITHLIFSNIYIITTGTTIVSQGHLANLAAAATVVHLLLEAVMKVLLLLNLPIVVEAVHLVGATKAVVARAAAHPGLLLQVVNPHPHPRPRAAHLALLIVEVLVRAVVVSVFEIFLQGYQKDVRVYHCVSSTATTSR